jgi:hypothetical protein
MAEPLSGPLFDPDLWAPLSLPERRELLARALFDSLAGEGTGIREASIGLGPVERPYDLTATVVTDVGPLRTPLWSHARAAIYVDPSIHPANRRQLAPGHALAEAVDRLRRRLNVPFTLESRGLTITQQLEDGVERVWTAERALFRNRTAVVREDRVANASGDVDVRDLLAHFYSGPALRLVGADGTAFLLPGTSEAEDARLVSLCNSCHQWAEGAHAECPHCGRAVEVVAAARPARH